MIAMSGFVYSDLIQYVNQAREAKAQIQAVLCFSVIFLVEVYKKSMFGSILEKVLHYMGSFTVFCPESVKNFLRFCEPMSTIQICELDD